MIEENLDIITMNRLLNIPNDDNDVINEINNYDIDYEQLLFMGGDVYSQREKSPNKITKIFNNIFGGEKQKNIPKISMNNDHFFQDLYEYYYAPVINMCSIDLSKIDKRERDMCRIIKKNKFGDDSDFVVMKIPFIKNIDIATFLTRPSVDKREILTYILDSYTFLLNNLRMYFKCILM